MKTSLVYMTAKDAAEAARIAEALVRGRLAACVNILGPIRSMYWWKGAVQRDREVALIAKTRASLVPRLIRKVKSLHSYTCPCIVALPITAGHKPFLAWIERETRSTRS